MSWICLRFLLTDPILNPDYMTFVCLWIFKIYLKGVKFCESKIWLFCNFLSILIARNAKDPFMKFISGNFFCIFLFCKMEFLRSITFKVYLFPTMLCVTPPIHFTHTAPIPWYFTFIPLLYYFPICKVCMATCAHFHLIKVRFQPSQHYL